MDLPARRTVYCATEPFIFLFIFSYSVHTTVLPQLTVSKICHEHYNSTVCSSLKLGKFSKQEQVVFAKAAMWNMVLFGLIFVPGLIGILPFGALSDLLSKRKLLLLPATTYGLQSIVYILCALYSKHVSTLIFGAILTGFYGDIQGGIVLSNAYMADVTEKNEDRTFRLVVIEGLTQFGLACGSFTSGIMLQKFGFQYAFALSLTASTLNIIYVIFFLPRSHEVEGYDQLVHDTQQHSTSLEQATFLFKETLYKVVIFIKKYFGSMSGLRVSLTVVAAFFLCAAVQGEVAILVLYFKHTPLSLSADDIGLYMFAFYLVRAVGIFLPYICSRFTKLPDSVVMICGALSFISTYAALAFCSTKQQLFRILPLAAGFSWTMSGLRAFLTKITHESESGLALSFLGIVCILGTVMTIFLLNPIFKATASFFPGLSILVLSFSSFLGLVFIVIVTCIKTSGEEDGGPGAEPATTELKRLLNSKTDDKDKQEFQQQQ